MFQISGRNIMKTIPFLFVNQWTQNIENEDREFIKALKNEIHSIQLQTTRYELLKHSNTITSIYLVFQQLAIQFEKICQRRTKKLSLQQKQITLQNPQYTQQFLNYIFNKDPFKLKFMYEMGIRPVDGQPTYGHSLRGSKWVETDPIQQNF